MKISFTNLVPLIIIIWCTFETLVLLFEGFYGDFLQCNFCKFWQKFIEKRSLIANFAQQKYPKGFLSELNPYIELKKPV